ncbi:MAG: hypothetical protein Q9175_004362 [Cornicularia normoerica]
MAENQYEVPIDQGNPLSPRFQVGDKVWIDAEENIQPAVARTYIVAERKQELITWKYSLRKDDWPQGEVTERLEEELSSAKEDGTV